MRHKSRIWYIHPYSGGPGVGRYDRAFHLCRYFGIEGHLALIIAPTYHHLMDHKQQSGAAHIDGVDYRFLRTPVYKGNGVGRLINMGCFSFGLLHTLPEIARDSGTPDFIIASSPHPYVWPAALRYARGVGARCILEVRDIWPQSLVDLAAVSRHHPLIRFTSLIEGRSYRQSDAVVSLLPFSRQYMIGKGVDPARWYHIPNGVEASSAYAPETPSSCLELARAKRASGQHVLVYAGALGRPNGVDSLLRGLAAAGDRATDVHAIIVGRGEMVSQLRALTVALGLKSRVSIFEQISKEATLSLLREVSAGYLSLIAEPVFDFGISPNKLFDYMLAGIPVVAAVDAPNNPVIEADCGLVADPDDANSIARAILELFSMTKEARYDMGRRAQRYVLERHAYDQLASKYLRLMADL